MKVIHLVDEGKAIVTFNKSGSTLFTYTLKLFLNWKGIEINAEYPNDKEVIALTRNPIRRFFSGFLHSHHVPKGGDWDFVERGDIIRRMEKWIDKCIEGEINGDFHYVRQGDIIDPIGGVIKTYRIEDISDELRRMSNWDRPNQNPDFESIQPLVKKGGLGLIEDLGIQMSHWDWQVFCGFYHNVKNNLEIQHHRGKETILVQFIIGSERPDLMKRIKNWLWEDIKRFGYGDIL